MQTVTLLSDWGTVDHYAAVVKAKLHSGIPDACIVDISHNVPRGDVYAAAFMMLDTYPYFPAGSIHIIGVEDIASSQTPHLLVRFDDRYFIGADNGFFTVLQQLSGKQAQEIREIEVWQETDVYTFPGRDLFPKVAAMLAGGCSPDEIGHPARFQFRVLAGGLLQKQPRKDRSGLQTGIRLVGKALYIDDFGNICTNITRTEFEACAKAYPFRKVVVGRHQIEKMPVKAYQDVEEGEIAFIFLDNGFMEIAINRGHAARLLGIDKRSAIYVLFGSQ